VKAASRDGDDVAQSRGWYVGRRIYRGNNGSVTFEHQTIELTYGDRYHIAQSGENLYSPVVVTSPAKDGSILLKRYAKILTSPDRDDVAQSRWNDGIPSVEKIVAPSSHPPRTCNCQGVVESRSEIRELFSGFDLRHDGIAPANHLTQWGTADTGKTLPAEQRQKQHYYHENWIDMDLSLKDRKPRLTVNERATRHNGPAPI
jgi:hypothetical protein